MEIKASLNKPYTEKERMNFIVQYNHRFSYEIRETEEALEAWGSDAVELLQQAKELKVRENDIRRDEALNAGVTYRDILFDSDTDQKVNLMYMADKMQPGDKVNWFGMDNQPLECTKEDLTNIGDLITQLHSFCWNKNAEIKALIAAAQTIEEVNEIDIHYILPLETESEETNED